MTKWTVLSFVIPEILVLGFIALMSPVVIGLGGGPLLPSYFFYGFLCALVPGALIWVVTRFFRWLEGRYPRMRRANEGDPDA